MAEGSPDAGFVTRFATRFVALVRLKSGDVEAVCTSLSLTGGFLTCETECKPGDLVEVSIQPPRRARTDVDLVGEVVYMVTKSGRGAPGLGLRWRVIQDADALALLLKSAALRQARDPSALVNFKETLVETPGAVSPVAVDIDGRTSTDTRAAASDEAPTVSTGKRKPG